MNQEFAKAIRRFSQHLCRRYPTSATAKHYENDLIHFGQVIDKHPRAVSRADITTFLTSQLAAGLKPATANRRIAALRSFFNFLIIEAEAEDWRNPVVWGLHGLKQGQHLPRDLSEPVARAFWASVCQGPVRDRALVALMLDVGLRVGEVTALEVSDFEPVTRPERLAGLRVRGKGDKERKVWLVAETASLIEAWLLERPNVADRSLFITRRRRGFTVRGIQDRVKHYTRRAGLVLSQVSCHKLRHTFARRMAESGMPLPSLSHWLGHRQLQTTKVYTDGAQLAVRADYQAAMAELSQVAERPEGSVTAPPVFEAPINPAVLLEPPPIPSQTELKDRVASLPDWLSQPIVAFIQARQGQWVLFQKRKHSFLWINTLRNAWLWLLEHRQVTSFAELCRVDLAAYMTHLGDEGLSASTRNVYLAIFLNFCRFLEEHEVDVAPSVYRVERSKCPERQPRPLTEGQYTCLERAVHQVTSVEPAGVAALECSWFFILSDGGLRIKELLTLAVDDWDPERRLLTIRFGKRGYQRRVPLTARAARAIDAHLAYRRPVHADEPLLVYRGKPLQKFHVTRWLGIFAAEARLGHITPHRLRHTYATRLIATGKMSIIHLQKLMGHRLLDTTMKYVALYDENVQHDYRTAVTQLDVESELDWDLWGPSIDTALEQDVPVATSP